MERMLFFLLAVTPIIPVIPLGGGIPALRLIVPAAVFVWFMRGAARKSLKIPFTPTFFLLFLFISYSVLSLLWSNEPMAGIRKAILWCTFFPLTLVLAEAVEDEKTFHTIVRGVGAGAIISAVVGSGQFLLQFIFGPEVVGRFVFSFLPLFIGGGAANAVFQFPSWFVNIAGITFLRSGGLFPDPHTFALYSGMTLPFVALCVMKQKEPVRSFFLLLPIIAVLFSFSRGAYFALILSTASTALIFRHRIIFFVRTRKKIFAGLLFALMIAFVTLQPIAQRFFSAFNAREGSNEQRIEIWRRAIDAAKENPIFGTGLGNFPATQDVFAENRSPINAHNTYIEVLVDEGIIGFLLFLSLFISLLWGRGRAWERAGPSERGIIGATLFSVIFFLLHGIFETIIFSPPNLVILTLLFAIMLRYAPAKRVSAY